MWCVNMLLSYLYKWSKGIWVKQQSEEREHTKSLKHRLSAPIKLVLPVKMEVTIVRYKKYINIET